MVLLCVVIRKSVIAYAHHWNIRDNNKPKLLHVDHTHFASDYSKNLPSNTAVHRKQYEPRREKTGLRGFRTGPTQTGL